MAGTFTATVTDGNGTSVAFNSPNQLTIDLSSLYVADTNNSTIRRVSIQTGEVTSLAGRGASGFADGTGGRRQFQLHARNHPRWGQLLRDRQPESSPASGAMMRAEAGRPAAAEKSPWGWRMCSCSRTQAARAPSAAERPGLRAHSRSGTRERATKVWRFEMPHKDPGSPFSDHPFSMRSTRM